MSLLLVILILVLAAAGGFLGDLLELAGWIIVFFALMGAVLAFIVYRWVGRLRTRFSGR